jgi:hypothetical protein
VPGHGAKFVVSSPAVRAACVPCSPADETRAA